MISGPAPLDRRKALRVCAIRSRSEHAHAHAKEAKYATASGFACGSQRRRRALPAASSSPSLAGPVHHRAGDTHREVWPQLELLWSPLL